MALTPAVAPLFSQEQLEARLSATTVRRIYDDNNDGATDTDPIIQLQKDASSKVRGTLGPVYDPDKLDPATLDEVVRLALDVAQAMAAQRHPEYVRIDGFKLMKQAIDELALLREGMSNLGTNAAPEPAANQGGDVDSDNPDEDEPEPKLFLGGTGLF